MKVETKKILEKTPEGEFILTEHGEFLSYLDAHLKLFENYLTQKKHSSEDHNHIITKIQEHMKDSIQGMDDFLAHMDTIASFLQTDVKSLTDYLTKHIMEVLTISQTKIKNQELDRLESSESFHSITEEILFKIGSIFPKSSHFVIKDELLVIQNTSNGQIIKPVGLLVEVKDDQTKAQKEKEATELAQKEKLEKLAQEKKIQSQAPTTPEAQTKAPEPIELEKETSILIEILELSLNFNGKKLEVMEVSTGLEEETNSEEDSFSMEPPQYKSELDLEEEPIPQHEDSNAFPHIEQEPEHDEIQESFEAGEFLQEDEAPISQEDDLHFEDMGITEDNFSLDLEESQDPDIPSIEPEIGSIDETLPDIDLGESESFEEFVPVETPKKLKPEHKINIPKQHSLSVNPAPFTSFTYMSYLQLSRSIEKLKEDKTQYSEWISKASPLIKTFVSIQATISKEISGEIFDWGEYYTNVSQKSGVDLKTVRDFKKTIEKLNLTKKFLEISVKELKKEPESVTKLLKTGWPHIVDAFGYAPDYDKVEENLAVLYSKIKDPSQKAPIEKILNKAIQKLRTI
jgi:hypothetical protein